MNSSIKPILAPGPTRRQFLAGACSLGISGLAAPALWAKPQDARRIRHAAIGVGGMGGYDLSILASHPAIDIVALCDVDERRGEAARKQFPEARFYQDWRELLAKEEIDSVNVSTPDHMHAPITMTALKLGRHVYCQKPLTHNIHEARMIGRAAEEAKVVTQMGTQLASSTASRTAVQWIRDGVIGKVREVFLWSNKPAGNLRPTGPRREGTDPVPAGLDWDAWLGVASERPHVAEVYHPSLWRGWQDFGCGWLGDMGCHMMDMPFRALDLGFPLSIKANVETAWADDAARRVETYPLWQVVEYLYPGTPFTSSDPLRITWSDGGKYPSEDLRKLIGGQDWPGEGALMIGEDGVMLFPHGGAPQVYRNMEAVTVKAPELEAQDHYHQFVNAILDPSVVATRSAFPYAARSTEMILLGTIALRFPDETLAWNAKEMRFPGVPAADGFVKRQYRAGWEVEGL